MWCARHCSQISNTATASNIEDYENVTLDGLMSTHTQAKFSTSIADPTFFNTYVTKHTQIFIIVPLPSSSLLPPSPLLLSMVSRLRTLLLCMLPTWTLWLRNGQNNEHAFNEELHEYGPFCNMGMGMIRGARKMFQDGNHHRPKLQAHPLSCLLSLYMLQLQIGLI